MAQIFGSPGENKAPIAVDVVRRDAAVARVRDLEKRIAAAEGMACRFRMAQGEALIPIRDSTPRGRWLDFLNDLEERHVLSVRNAQIAIQLAEKREEIKAANAKSSSPLSIAAALRLIRPKKPTKPASEPKTADPYSAETLAKLPPEVRAQLFANLNATITIANLPKAIADDIERNAFDRGIKEAGREAVMQEQAAQTLFIANIRAIRKTGASPAHQLDDVDAAIERLDEVTQPRRFCPGAYVSAKVPVKSATPSNPDQEPLMVGEDAMSFLVNAPTSSAKN